jgi:hypothetical protein
MKKPRIFCEKAKTFVAQIEERAEVCAIKSNELVQSVAVRFPRTPVEFAKMEGTRRETGNRITTLSFERVQCESMLDLASTISIQAALHAQVLMSATSISGCYIGNQFKDGHRNVRGNFCLGSVQYLYKYWIQ